jgi:tRNA(fMet)-specific endonuclease VapC
MLRYMLDTNILIFTVKNKPEVVRQQFEAHEGEICTSSVTAMEMLYGAHKSQSVRCNLDVIDALLSRLTVPDFDLAAAEHAGAIRASLASDGRPIGPYDTMIAGHARSLGLVLVTNKVGEFRRVSGLRLENWAE